MCNDRLISTLLFLDWISLDRNFLRWLLSLHPHDHCHALPRPLESRQTSTDISEWSSFSLLEQRTYPISPRPAHGRYPWHWHRPNWTIYTFEPMILADRYPMLQRWEVICPCRQSRYLTVNQTFRRRLSATRPRSNTRPRTVVSILPPQSGITTLNGRDHSSEWNESGNRTFFLSIPVINLEEQPLNRSHQLLQGGVYDRKQNTVTTDLRQQPFPFPRDAELQ